MCGECGSLLSPQQESAASRLAVVSIDNRRKWFCTVCKSSDSISMVDVPYSFKYLTAELAAVNIRVKLSLEQ